jgi:hypothetical protein
MAAIRKTLRLLSQASSARAAVLVAAVILVAAAPVRAHHSVPVNFDSSKEVTITGTLTEAKWINPHSRFRINVKQDDGTTVEWLVEMGAANTMRRAGFAIDKFVVGDTLTIIGWPGRDRERTMLLRTAVLKDGTKLSPT